MTIHRCAAELPAAGNMHDEGRLRGKRTGPQHHHTDQYREQSRYLLHRRHVRTSASIQTRTEVANKQAADRARYPAGAGSRKL